MTDELHNPDYETLLAQARTDKTIPQKALEAIRDQLVSGEYEADPYTLLHILGKARDVESLPIIESYPDYGLEYPEDDGMVRRIALQVIGRTWAMPEAFEIAARKAFHDPSPDVQDAAPTIIGFLGARHPYLKPRAASLLVRGWENLEVEDEVWESFHAGLLELFEVPVTEWPLTTRSLKKEDDRWDLITKAKHISGPQRQSNTKNNG